MRKIEGICVILAFATTVIAMVLTCQTNSSAGLAWHVTACFLWLSRIFGANK